MALTSGVALTSCEPQKAEGVFESPEMSSESLMEGATFAQYDMVDGKYVPSSDGNYIQYNFPNVPSVGVYYMKNGENKPLYPLTGNKVSAGGIIYYMPSRGSEPLQSLYFSYLNADGKEVVVEKQFTFKVAQALDPAVKVLVSNAGTKKWKWMPTNVNGGAVWGNGGYLAGAQDGGLDINGAWWGCGVEDGDCGDKFNGQTQHAGDRWNDIKGECYSSSYMEFNEDGSLIAYSNDGVKVNEGSFVITDYNKNEITNEEQFSRGTLQTSAGAILWPFAINTGGGQPEAFEIGWLDEARMVLIYAADGTGGWGECTWWSFMSDDDPTGILASHEWRWRPTEVNGGAVWGNGGYLAGAQDGTGNINGAWWGCGPVDGSCGDTFAGQMQHKGDAYVEGEEYVDSKMVFNEDEGAVTLYGPDGKELRAGSFSFNKTPNPDNFSIGTLETSAGAILWPFAINTGGFMPTAFEVGYLGSNSMVLIYAAEGTGGWSECTWWSFGK